MTDRDPKPENPTGYIQEPLPLTDEQVEQRWAWMAIQLRELDNLEGILDPVCQQAIEANALRAALAEALEMARLGYREDVYGTRYEYQARIAETHAKFLGTR